MSISSNPRAVMKLYASSAASSIEPGTRPLDPPTPAWSKAMTCRVFAIGSIMVVFPALEAFAALCVGCVIFAQLIRLGIVPERICLECADITDRLAARLREDVAAA